MALTYAGHIQAALIEVGRPGDTTLTTLANNVYIDALYDKLNRIHQDRSLNCARYDQTVALTAVHNGLIPVPTEYRDTKWIQVVDAANNNAQSNIVQGDYFVLQVNFPPATARGIPRHWAWVRSSTSASAVMAFGDTIELFPKPDRNLTLTHTFYRWLKKTAAVGSDIILKDWGELMHSWLVYSFFKQKGEHEDAAQWERKIAMLLDDFAQWDDCLHADEDPMYQPTTREGLYEMPIMED